jgi:dihydropteroate synthase
MGILNVTPDSFSDAGCFVGAEEACARGAKLVAEGADIVDVGGESTRPGAEPVAAAEEIRRVVPVIAALAAAFPTALVSVDTTKAAVADAAADAGAKIVNDVSAGADPAMLRLVAARSLAVVLMHRRGDPQTMQRDTAYLDVVAEVTAYLAERAAVARAAGVPRALVFLDPGIGFGKGVDGNLRLLASLEDLASLGYPVVIGASRKSFIGALTGAPVGDRLAGSLAAAVAAAGLRRAVVRVHDVAATVQFLTVRTAVAGAA